MIHVRDLTFRRPDWSLTLPRWDVPEAGRVAVHGPSGSGKSTLLDLLGGVLAPHAGTLDVAGTRLSTLGEAGRRAFRIRTVGFVFQDAPLLDHLGALDNVLLPYRLHPSMKLDAGVRARARVLLVDLGLAGLERRRPSALSQGERQRVAIARALIASPRLVLADEPTSGLDPERTIAVLDLLDRLCAAHRATLVLVTHDPAVLDRFDDRLDVGALSEAR